jgi:hypothetical protein
MKTWFAAFVLVGFQCFAQNKSSDASLPSKAEISELLSKADEKVSGFEQAIKTVKPTLAGIDFSLTAKELDAASTTHTIIQAIQKNGPTGYGLVGLVATLDDLNSNASRSALVLVSADRDRVLTGGRSDPNTAGFVVALTSAGNACNDIAELIMHATLRYLSVEEAVLSQLLDSKK